MIRNRVNNDDTSTVESVMDDAAEVGFRPPQLPKDIETQPALPLDLPPLTLADPKPDKKAEASAKPIVKLRRNKRAPHLSHSQKTYRDLFHDAFVINFSGTITSYNTSGFIEQCQNALRADNESVLVHMSSGGGQMDEGMRIYEQLRMMSAIKPVYVLASGYFYSACVWVAMALPVENRWITQNSRVMIHPAQSNNADGKAVPRGELDAFSREQLDYYNDRWVIDEIARHSNIRRGDLRRLVEEDGQDVYLTAGRAVKLGIFAGIV